MKYALSIIIPIYSAILIGDNFGDTIWKTILMLLLFGISTFAALKWVAVCEKRNYRH